jgi:S1-C subfamily serine protease
VHPGYLQFIDEGGQNIQWNCPSFTEAVVDGEYIREISCGVGRCRIKAASRAAATEVFEAVNRTCKIKIGLSIERLTPERAGQLGLDRNSAGLVVVTVLPGSMAEKSGIMAGDILEEIMDLPVAKPEEAVAALRAAADRGAKVLINRRGEQMVLTIGP